MEHTPIPWAVRDNKLEISSAHDPNGSTATCHLRVNAAFIVRAVNNHEKLLAALEGLDTEYTRLCVATMDYASNRPEIVQQARDAIEAAKGDA